MTITSSTTSIAQLRPDSEAVGRAVGAGRWESPNAAGDKRDWQIEIERFADDSIAGSIIVIGSPYLHKARIEGRVEGKEVYGVLVGDNESQVGTFSGTITDSGLSGTYTTKQGDSGNWSWAGPEGARSLKGDAQLVPAPAE
jgi:hypothetical protein